MPNLAQWLRPYVKDRGNVTPLEYRELLDAAREAAGIEMWPNNALRHSFASYHLARFQDAAALAHELGHTNATLIYQHYRQVVRPAQAARYWKITPTAARNNVIQFCARTARSRGDS